MIVGENIQITTASDGSATAYSGRTYNGYFDLVVYTKDDFADGSTMTIVTESNIPIWAETGVNASAVRRPRATTHTAAGVAATYDGTRAVLERVAIGDERIKIVIASGGDTKSGTFTIFVDGQ